MDDLNYDQIEEMENSNWWYQGKRDLLDRLLTGKNFSKALDIGCGVGSNLSVMQKHVETVIGVDNSPKAVDYCARKGFNAVIGDIHKLSFEAEHFDLVMCSDVLEHVDDVKAVSEVNRVLKKGGAFIFSVPANNHLWNDNDDFSHHLRRYDKKMLSTLLKDFDIKQLKYWNAFSYVPCAVVYPIQRLRKNRDKVNNLTLIPSKLNGLLYKMISLENKLFSKLSMPQGVSLIGVAVKR
ncbi:MAG: hypothetical protein CMH61_03030 [Nanoarchaeota archaeon]|nr:hypothetical protein [Nanoarchaeota archaeon]|tara:strand:+ start:6333 stop:7043 length:711 start_codon:yes stop_codon:yes gene_type:complete